MSEPVDNYEDVTVYGLDDDDEAEMLDAQNECTFIWSNKEGWPVGVIMSYIFRDGKFWLTASSQRARISAVKRDPRVCIVVTSTGSKMARNKTVTYKGTCTIHDDQATKDWFYPACAAVNIPTAGKLQDAFAHMMDTERRLVIEVVPEKWITFDATKMMMASIEAWKKEGILD